MKDVLISGGGVAGASLAILLGRAGLTVDLLERAHFPREKPCGEGLMPAGVAALRRLGVDAAIEGAPFYGIRYHFRRQIAEGRFPAQNGEPALGLGLRRLYFDHILFRMAAEAAGVAAHEGVRVEAPLLENGRVVGVVAEGQARRARLVVAADGVHSTLRHALGLERPPRRRRLGVCVHFRLAEGRLQPPWVDVFVARGHELYVTPLPRHELLVAALTDAGSFAGPLDGMFRRWYLEQRELAERLEGAQQLTEMAGMYPLSGRALRGYAPGIVLHGDAAGFLDPITGGGMTQAHPQPSCGDGCMDAGVRSPAGSHAA
jgi:flavin-dependent dehydrogenase